MILYFSGTGNSRYAAERIGAQTGETPVSLNDRIRAGDLTPLPAAPSFVIVAPTYAWRLPRPVERHLRAGVLPRGAAVWFVLTCGDGAGAAALYCRRLCADLGLRFFGLRAVVMPENYLALFPVPTEAEGRAAVRRADPVLAETGSHRRRAAAAGHARHLEGPAVQRPGQRPVLPLRDPRPGLLRHRRLHRLRGLRGPLPARRHPHGGRPPPLGRTLHPLHGLHRPLPAGGDRIRQTDGRKAALAS